MHIVTGSIDEALLAGSLLLLATQAYAVRWGRSLTKWLPKTDSGGGLLRIILTMATVTLASQLMFSVAFAFLLSIDRIGTLDIRVAIFAATQIVAAAAVLWAMWSIRKIRP